MLFFSLLHMCQNNLFLFKILLCVDPIVDEHVRVIEEIVNEKRNENSKETQQTEKTTNDWQNTSSTSSDNQPLQCNNEMPVFNDIGESVVIPKKVFDSIRILAEFYVGIFVLIYAVTRYNRILFSGCSCAK